MIESLNNRIKELEAELNEMKQIAESTQQVFFFLNVYFIVYNILGCNLCFTVI